MTDRLTALESVHTEALTLADLMQTMPFWDESAEVAAQLARLQRALRAATDALVVAKAGG